MASTAGHMTREFSIFDFGSFARAVWMPVAVRGGQAAGFFSGDDLTSRALASAGIAALVTLPFLLLSSVVLAAPLAVPPAIGLGYLAVSHAMGSQRHRWAVFINSAVLLGLVGWLLLFLTSGEGPVSSAGLIAALLAPVFAAAPAFARSLIAKAKLQEKDAAIVAREAALDRVAWLDQLAPAERTVILDGEGSNMRIEPAPAPEPETAEPERIAASPLPATIPRDLAVAPSCDLGEAIAFALRHAARRADAKGAGLSFFADPDLVAACDRQVGRRVAYLMLDAGLNGCGFGGAVALSAQRKKGVALLRITTLPQKDATNIETGPRGQHDVAELQGLVESAGGTVMLERRDLGTALSVRLPLARAAGRE